MNETKCQLTPSAFDGTHLANTSLAITTAGAKGYDFSWNGILLNPPPNLKATFCRQNILANSYNAVQDLFQGYFPVTGTQGTSDFLGQGEGNSTGNAKPQYVPRKAPWKCLADYLGFGNQCNGLGGTPTGDYTYTQERNVCYGTYLPASTAQVRRTRQASNQAITTNGTNNDNWVNYYITNLKYVGIQTILPDEVTATIVRQAASSDISLHAQSVRTYKSILSQSLSQNLILPVKVASANSLWVIFQNQAVINNTHYSSMTRHCPFSSFQWTPSQKCFVGSETTPTIRNVPTINPFQIQLRIGNELLPIQPMTCVQHVIAELQRSVHGLGDMKTTLPFSNSFRNFRWLDNTHQTSSAQTEYNCLKSGDFLVPYIPVQALDDQTITNNPAFMDHHDFANTGFSTWDAYNDRGPYVVHEFLPPTSKFLLGFDLDTFPGANDVARSGRYLGNAPLTLQMTNTYAAANASVSGNGGQVDSIAATAIVLHDIRFSIMAGGQVLAYY